MVGELTQFINQGLVIQGWHWTLARLVNQCMGQCAQSWLQSSNQRWSTLYVFLLKLRMLHCSNFGSLHCRFSFTSQWAQCPANHCIPKCRTIRQCETEAVAMAREISQHTGSMGHTNIRDWKPYWDQVYNFGSWMKLTNLKGLGSATWFPSHFVYQKLAIGWFHDNMSRHLSMAIWLKRPAQTGKLEIQPAVLTQAAHWDLDNPYPAKSGTGEQCCSGTSQPVGDGRSGILAGRDRFHTCQNARGRGAFMTGPDLGGNMLGINLHKWVNNKRDINDIPWKNIANSKWTLWPELMIFSQQAEPVYFVKLASA